MSSIIKKDKHLYSIEELKNLHLSNYKIQKLIQEGILKKMNRSYYENLTYIGDFNEMSYIQAYVPRGVLCLMSAAAYYGLTNTRPQEINFAIDRSDKVYTRPEWPCVHLYYFSKSRYSTGIKEVQCNTNERYRIYDIDKTMADILYYREKIGIEETKIILKNYLHSEKRNLNQLYRYSKQLGCHKILKTYMEVLL